MSSSSSSSLLLSLCPLSSRLTSLRESSAHLTDVKLVCFNGVEWAHRLVLAAASPLLKTLLSEDTMAHASTILLPQLHHSALKLILDYVYTGQMCVAPDQLADVVHALEVLQLKCGVSVSKMNCGDVKIDHAESCVKWENLYDLYENASDLKDEKKERHNANLDDDLKVDSAEEKEDKKDDEQRRRKSEGAKDEDSKNERVQVPEEEEESSDSENIEEIVDPDDDEEDGYTTTTVKCVMCPQSFDSHEELKNHVQKHLGVRNSDKNCPQCERSFRNSLESELHKRSHELSVCIRPVSLTHAVAHKIWWSRQRVDLARRRIVLLPLVKQRVSDSMTELRAKQKITTGDGLKLTTKVKFVEPPRSLECDVCHKHLASQRSLIRHKQTQHIAQSGSANAKKRTANDENKEIKESEQPQRKKPKRAPTSRESSDLTCPTCDKSFIAESIFERHLRTYKHGRYAMSSSTTPALLSTSQSSLPASSSLRSVEQPRMVLGGREMNKYECHLCHAIFVRVKDLAKHRARICSAWKTMAGGPQQ